MHGHCLIVEGWIYPADGIREAQLQTHQNGQPQRNQADKNSNAAVLYCNDLVILTPDIFGHKALRIVHCVSIILVG